MSPGIQGLIVRVHRSPAVALAFVAFVAFPDRAKEASMLIIKGPGIGPEDIERSNRRCATGKAAQRKVVEKATTIVLEYQAELARHGLFPEPPSRL